MSIQRVILADFYQQPPKYYHATFDHLSHTKAVYGKTIPVALLKNIYLVDSKDNRLANVREDTYIDQDGNPIIADHCWVQLNQAWFKLPRELLQGDEIYFKAEVEQYNITRDDLAKKRKLIWEKAKQLNDGIYSAWQGSKHMYHGVQYQSAYEQMRSHIQSNNEMARLQQQNIPMVDYTLTDLSDIQVIKYLNHTERRIKYNYKQYLKQHLKYSGWLVARSMSFAQTGQIS